MDNQQILNHKYTVSVYKVSKELPDPITNDSYEYTGLGNGIEHPIYTPEEGWSTRRPARYESWGRLKRELGKLYICIITLQIKEVYNIDTNESKTYLKILRRSDIHQLEE